MSQTVTDPDRDSSTRPDPDVLLPPDVRGRWRDAVAEVAGDEIADVYSAALMRTLARTLHRQTDGTYFVITGDIPAMWLRDSTTQMWPYLTIAGQDPDGPLADLLIGIVRRQLFYLRHDPYANAFNATANGRHHEPRDLGDDPWLWERKYEIDSLCFPIQFAHQIWQATGRHDHLDADFLAAACAVVDTLRAETDHATSTYRFVRPDTVQQDTLPREGRGSLVGWTGLSWSGFRPSDDACTYGYNVPANLSAAHCLRLLADLVAVAELPTDVIGEALELADSLSAAVARWGVVAHPVHGEIYAYEVDGLGGHLLMDDANMPGLLSLPLTAGVAVDDQLYQRTRGFVLSADNPQYWSGSRASGVGSPHTPPSYVWPIALAVQGLTSQDRDERLALLRLLTDTTAGTGHLHESFDVNDPSQFTRPWFSWADSMFCLLAQSLLAPCASTHAL